MEKRSSIEKCRESVSSRTNSSKDLSTSHASIKSNKSVDNQNLTSNSVSKSVIIESQEKDTVINKGVDSKKITVPLDGTTKIPHKFITNWRLACDRTKDRTRELLKRWKTLSEFEGIEQAQHVASAKAAHLQDKNIPNDKTATDNDKSGWSVHVWSKYHISTSSNTFIYFTRHFMSDRELLQNRTITNQSKLGTYKKNIRSNFYTSP